MSKGYLDRYKLPHSTRETFIKSIERVYNERVEVHIGNHTGDNKHAEKLEKKLAGAKENPVIDTTTWQWFLDLRKAQALEKFEQDKL